MSGRTYPRSRPNDAVSRKRSDGVVCWYCGKRGHIKRNCEKLKTSVETAAVGSCLSVDGRLGKLVVKILIDTGSAATLVREDVWKKVQQSPKTIKAPVHSVVAANGEKLELVGQGEIYDNIPLSGVAEDVCFVSISETVTVPACCQMYISASALDKKEAGAVLLEPLDTFMEDHGLLVARSLSQVSCNHLVVQVLNPGPAPVVVNKDVRVGVIKPVTDSDIVCSIESTKSNRHVGHSECAHLIELMLQNTEHLSSYHKSQGVTLLQEFEDVIAKSDDDLGTLEITNRFVNTQEGSHSPAQRSEKSPPRNKAPLEVSHAIRPLERIAMDILGPLPETPRGNRCILVVGDYFTKWTEAYPLPDMEALSIAKVLVNEFICRFGVPDSIHTDQGKNFEAKVIQEICHLLGVTKTRTTPYHPQSDGLVERFNRTLLEMLSTTVADEHDWDLSLPTLLLAYRTSVQETTGITPFQLMFGRNPRLPEDILYSLPVASHDSVTQYTRVLKGRLERSYQAYQELGKSRKLHKPWQGPYRVVKAISPSVYRIVDCARPRCKHVVHFNRLKPAPLGNVPPTERVVNEEEHMEHSGDTAEEKEEEELFEFTEMDQPVITPQDAVEINQPPIAVLPTPPVIDAPHQHAVPPNAALPIPPEANNHRDAVPAGLRRSSRRTKPPERYWDPITLRDVWTHLIEEDAQAGT
ncbi:hypothetical protein EMCRGX_G010502 [Ephydatia muelleri]